MNVFISRRSDLLSILIIWSIVPRLLTSVLLPYNGPASLGYTNWGMLLHKPEKHIATCSAINQRYCDNEKMHQNIRGILWTPTLIMYSIHLNNLIWKRSILTQCIKTVIYWSVFLMCYGYVTRSRKQHLYFQSSNEFCPKT